VARAGMEERRLHPRLRFLTLAPADLLRTASLGLRHPLVSHKVGGKPPKENTGCSICRRSSPDNLAVKGDQVGRCGFHVALGQQFGHPQHRVVHSLHDPSVYVVEHPRGVGLPPVPQLLAVATEQLVGRGLETALAAGPATAALL